MSRGPHVVVIAFHFPPSRSSAVYRTRAWANTLARAGCRVSVVTAQRDWFVHATGGIDDELATTIDPRVRVHRVRFGYQRYSPHVESMSWLNANFPFLHDTVFGEWPQRRFPERHALWYPAAASAAIRLGLRRRPHLIVATGNPYAGYAAARTAARWLRVPYALDFHDTWTLNQFTGEDAYPEDHPALTWERRVVDDARLLVTVNNPLRDWYVGRYPQTADRFRVVENGWAPDVVHDVRPLYERNPKSPIRFGYVGTLRRDLPLEEFFDGWRAARKQPGMRDATFDLYGYLEYFALNEHKVADRLPLGKYGVAHHGPVSQTKLAATYSDLDALVNLLPSSPYVSSGKVYDYLASGRAIVAVHDTTTAASDVRTGYPLWYGMEDVTADAVTDALVAAADGVRSATPETTTQAAEIAAHHTWEAHLAPVVEEITGRV